MGNSNKPVLLDGASGTLIWSKTEDKLPVWIYNITKPEIIKEVHKEYIDAGSQVIYSNTFGANRPSVERSSDYSVDEVVKAAIKIAREAVAGTDVKIALDMGPLTEMMEPYGDLEEDEVAEIYGEMIQAAITDDFKPDMIIFETFLDLNMLTVAATEAMKYDIPVWCTMTFEKIGKTMFGNSVEDVIDELSEIGVSAIGMNCSLGPDEALKVITEFSEKTDLPLIYKPNAGMPVADGNGNVVTPYTAERFADEVAPALSFVSYIGGCCGSDPGFIKAVKEKL